MSEDQSAIPEQWLTTKEVAALLGIPPYILDNWRKEGKGPRYCLLGACDIRYSPRDVREFQDQCPRAVLQEEGALISEQDAAALVGLNPPALRKARSRGNPIIPFVRIGHSIRYSPSVIAEFLGAAAGPAS